MCPTPAAVPEGDSGTDSATFVQSLARGLAVVRAFDAAHPTLTLAEVAERTELSRASARRFLLTLEALGYVRVEGRQFALTPRVLELGMSYLLSLGLPAVAQPHLEQLSRELQESVSVSVLEGHDIVYVARAAHNRIMSVRIEIGTRFPAYATAMGRVLLAALPEDQWPDGGAEQPLAALTPRTLTDPVQLRAALERVRSDGSAEVDGELELGLRSVAVPIRSAHGVVAAVNVATNTASGGEESTERQIELLTATAQAIESDLRLAHPPSSTG